MNFNFMLGSSQPASPAAVIFIFRIITSMGEVLSYSEYSGLTTGIINPGWPGAWLLAVDISLAIYLNVIILYSSISTFQMLISPDVNSESHYQSQPLD